MLVYCCHDSLRFCNVPMYVFFIVLVVLGCLFFVLVGFFSGVCNNHFWCDM